MISCAAGRAGIYNCIFWGGRIFCFSGKSCICVFSVLCGSCVVAVSYTSRAIFGCRVGDPRSLWKCAK